MEFLLQTSLFYILQTVVYTHTTTNLSQNLYAIYKANMLLLCCITLFVSESFIIFSMSHDCITCDCDTCYIFIMLCDIYNITYNIISHSVIGHFEH